MYNYFVDFFFNFLMVFLILYESIKSLDLRFGNLSIADIRDILVDDIYCSMGLVGENEELFWYENDDDFM